MTVYNFEVARIDSRPVTGKFGPATVYDLVGADGTKYSYGFTNPSKAGITVGTVVTGSGTSDKWGVKIDPKTVTVGGGLSASPKAADASAKPHGGSASYGKIFPVPKTHGDTAIIRQNALTNAVATVADFIATQPTEKWPSLEEWQDMVIATALKYAEFSSGQREVKASIKKLQEIGMDAAEIHTAVSAHLGEVAPLDEEASE